MALPDCKDVEVVVDLAVVVVHVEIKSQCCYLNETWVVISAAEEHLVGIQDEASVNDADEETDAWKVALAAVAKVVAEAD